MDRMNGWFVFRNTDVLFPLDYTFKEALSGISLDSCESFNDLEQRFLLRDQDESFGIIFLESSMNLADLDRWQAMPVRMLLGSLQAPLLAGFDWQVLSRFLRAYHAAQWRQSSRFCGFCGSPQIDAEDELARQCTRCGRREYPRISPAVIVAITDAQNRLLLAHNGKFNGPMYSLVAGFVEAGERLEDTVHREIREEVGLEVDSVSYVGSQPWPFPASLMLAFEAKYSGGELRCDGKEILDARWVTPDTLPELPSGGSISRFLIDRWLTTWNK